MGYLSHFSLFLISIAFVFFSIQEKLNAIKDVTESIDKRLDKFAHKMGPWGKKIFHDTPDWVREEIALERSRIGAVNKKTGEWIEQLKVRFKSSDSQISREPS